MDNISRVRIEIERLRIENEQIRRQSDHSLRQIEENAKSAFAEQEKKYKELCEEYNRTRDEETRRKMEEQLEMVKAYMERIQTVQREYNERCLSEASTRCTEFLNGVRSRLFSTIDRLVEDETALREKTRETALKKILEAGEAVKQAGSDRRLRSCFSREFNTMDEFLRQAKAEYERAMYGSAITQATYALANAKSILERSGDSAASYDEKVKAIESCVLEISNAFGELQGLETVINLARSMDISPGTLIEKLSAPAASSMKNFVAEAKNLLDYSNMSSLTDVQFDLLHRRAQHFSSNLAGFKAAVINYVQTIAERCGTICDILGVLPEHGWELVGEEHIREKFIDGIFFEFSGALQGDARIWIYSTVNNHGEFTNYIEAGCEPSEYTLDRNGAINSVMDILYEIEPNARKEQSSDYRTQMSYCRSCVDRIRQTFSKFAYIN